MNDTERVTRLADKLGRVPSKREIQRAFRWGGSRANKARQRAAEARPALEAGSATSSGRRDAPRVSWSEQDGRARLEAFAQEITDPEHLLREAGVNMEHWRIRRWKITRHEMGRKAKQTDLTWTDGSMDGTVHDTGEIHVQDLWNITVELEPRRDVLDIQAVADAAEELLLAAAPAWPAPPTPTAPTSGYLLEVAVPDLHLGKLAWAAETGESYDLKLAEQAFRSAITSLLARASSYPIQRVLFPVGNDLLHVDSDRNETTKGTRQDVDSRWPKAFQRALELMTWAIGECGALAPVDVVMVPGNHAEVLEQVLGVTIQAYYRDTDRVLVEASPRPRKYYRWGEVLLGFAHGHREKPADLPLLMAEEARGDWAETSWREWHLGHLHHRRAASWGSQELELNGATVRHLPSLSANDAWHSGKGYLSMRAAQAFLWHEELGLEAAFTFRPRSE